MGFLGLLGCLFVGVRRFLVWGRLLYGFLLMSLYWWIFVGVLYDCGLIFTVLTCVLMLLLGLLTRFLC